MKATYNKKFLNESPRGRQISDNDVDYGYCINCRLDDLSLAKLVILGKIRKVKIDCDCGCKVGYFDMDLEEYRVWDFVQKDVV